MSPMINFCGNCGDRVCDHIKEHMRNLQTEVELLREQLDKVRADKESNDKEYLRLSSEYNSLHERHKWLYDFYVYYYKSSLHPDCFGSLPNIQQQAENDCIRCNSKKECFK